MLLDVHMPGASGVQAAEEIANALPGTAVVLVTCFSRFTLRPVPSPRQAPSSRNALQVEGRVQRADLFDNLAQLVKRDTDVLAELMARECGKVVTECRAEVIEGLHMIQYVFGTGRMPAGEVLVSEIAEKDAFVRRKPWGVCAVITPWNFPFAVPLWMLGPSLVEGNTVVF